jgi:hypothetical protein
MNSNLYGFEWKLIVNYSHIFFIFSKFYPILFEFNFIHAYIHSAFMLYVSTIWVSKSFEILIISNWFCFWDYFFDSRSLKLLFSRFTSLFWYYYKSLLSLLNISINFFCSHTASQYKCQTLKTFTKFLM